jgi:hypothetical protein
MDELKKKDESQICAYNYKGPICGVCNSTKNNRIKFDISGKCLKCPSNFYTVSILFFIIILLLLIWILMIKIFILWDNENLKSVCKIVINFF